MTHVPLFLSICWQIHIDLYLPSGKRFNRSLDLFSAIDPDASSFKVLGTKVGLKCSRSVFTSKISFAPAVDKVPNYVSRLCHWTSC